MKKINDLIIKTKADVIERVKSEAKDSKLIFTVTIITAVLCYYIYIITGYASPDGVSEGLLYYRNGDWAAACGRWFTRYFNLIFGHNIVSPLLVVCGYCLFITLSLLMLKNLFEIQGKVELVILSAIMIASPAVSTQLMYPYIFVAYSASFFFSVLACALAWKGKFIRCSLAVLSTILMMGMYQSYVSSVIVIVIMLAIFELMNNGNILITFLRCIKCAAVSVCGCLINNVIYKKEIERRGLMASGRVDSFSFDVIFEDIGKSLYKSRHFFSDYFLYDSILGKNVMYIILLFVLLIGLVGCAIRLIKNHKGKGIALWACIAVLSVMLPYAMNTIYILVPYNKVYLVMQYHYVLIFVFIVMIYQRLDIKYNVFRTVFTILMAVIICANVYNINATWLSMRQSYQAIETQTRLILDDVYDTEGFIPNITPIVFVGFPSEEQEKNMLEIYQFSTGLNPNQAFWLDINGETTCREHYIKTYFGIDPGHLTEDDFYSVVENPEVGLMPIWPQKGSVKMINGMCVVRLTESDYPTRPE